MKILLGITGSIAAYKAPDIARGLINQGHEVKVVLTKGALEFVNPQVFKFLGVAATYLPDEDFKHQGVLHIELSKWCDTFALVPLSANTLSKLARGECSDLLTSVYLSLPPTTVKVLYPAMNTFMYANPITQENLKKLLGETTYLIEPDSGVLACGDEGKGKLSDVRSIIEMLPTYSQHKVNKKVVITAGATLSNLDPVRYVTNPAKGGTAYVLAKKYLSAGYQVHVIQGQEVIGDFKYLTKHPHYTFEVVSTTQDLLQSVKKLTKKFDIYISPMAVSDIEFDYVDSKIKKSTLKGSFKFQFAADVLKYVLDHKTKGQKIVGFAAETDLTLKTIQEKMNRKPVDLLVANLVNSGFNGSHKQGFGTRDGIYKLVLPTKSGLSGTETEQALTKIELAEKIFNLIN
jgi:phosphopantothenoylcysteine decarboxylase/phosphopantothenate--cysteine ligase